MTGDVHQVHQRCMLHVMRLAFVAAHLVQYVRRYQTAMLIEIDAHSLFSKYFSESGKYKVLVPTSAVRLVTFCRSICGSVS